LSETISMILGIGTVMIVTGIALVVMQE